MVQVECIERCRRAVQMPISTIFRGGVVTDEHSRPSTPRCAGRWRPPRGMGRGGPDTAWQLHTLPKVAWWLFHVVGKFGGFKLPRSCGCERREA